jgi:hypothetical protein
MKTYGRRDFLKMLGVGAGILGGSAVAEPLLKVGQKLAVDLKTSSGPVYFPWQFDGESELAAYVSECDHAILTALQTGAPPDGYRFLIRGLSMWFGEDCMVEDARRFVESFSLRITSGSFDLLAPTGAMMTGGICGISGGAVMNPIYPEIGLKQDQPLQINFEGKPFPLTGPMKVFTSVYGVGYQIPETVSLGS